MRRLELPLAWQTDSQVVYNNPRTGPTQVSQECSILNFDDDGNQIGLEAFLLQGFPACNCESIGSRDILVFRSVIHFLSISDA